MPTYRPTRRQAIKTAATGLLAAPLIVPSWARGQAPSQTLTMGCIGVGSMGTGDMNQFLNMDDVRVLAVCDVDSDHRAKAANTVNEKYGNKDCKQYADFREVVARDDLDLIMIATPDHWHALAGLAAVRAGKDVYCEKPITHTFEEGVALYKAVAQHKCIWQTGSQQRSTSNFHRAVELVLNGKIGKLKHVVVGLPTGRQSPPHEPSDPPPTVNYDFYCGPSKLIPFDKNRFHWHWRWNLNFGGGQLMDWINHHNDIAHWGMGMDKSGPVEVKATGTFPPEGSCDNAATTYSVDCVYPNGVTSNISNANRMGTRFEGEDGWIHVDRGSFEGSNPEFRDAKFDRGPIKAYHSTHHHRNFIECVKSRKETICPPETAHRSCTPGHLAYASMFTGRTIKWDPQKEQIINDPGAEQYLKFTPRGEWKL